MSQNLLSQRKVIHYLGGSNMKEQLLSMLIQADIFTAEEPDSKKINEMDPKKLYKDKEGRKLFVDHYDFIV